MGKIEKFLRKLSPSNRQIVKEALVKVLSSDLQGLNVKKLKGHQGLFRVRIGNVRIVFSQEEGVIYVVFIGKRGSSGYKKF